MTSDECERRDSERLLVELNVSFCDLGRPEESFEDVARNLSEGGVFIETSVGLPLGTPLQLEVRFGPGKPSVVVNGEVIRVEAEMGVTGSTQERRVVGLAIHFQPGQTKAVERLIRQAQP